MRKIIMLCCCLITGSLAHSQIVNGGMEQWRSHVGYVGLSLETPVGWDACDSGFAEFTGPGQLTFDSLGNPIQSPVDTSTMLQRVHQRIFKTTEAHSGNYAAKIRIPHDSLLAGYGNALTNGTFNYESSLVTDSFSIGGISVRQDCPALGGAPVPARVPGVKAWIKFRPVNPGNEMATIRVLAILKGQGGDGTDLVIGKGELNLKDSIKNYQLAEVPITYYDASSKPDHIQVTFLNQSQNTMEGGGEGAELIIDDVAFMTTTGIGSPTLQSNAVRCYPNPASDVLHISTDIAGEWICEIRDIAGRSIVKKGFKKDCAVSLEGLRAGIYLYCVMDKSGAVLQPGKFTITRP